MIKPLTKAWGLSDGSAVTDLPTAKLRELELLAGKHEKAMSDNWHYESVASFMMEQESAILDILTTGPRSRPARRKVNIAPIVSAPQGPDATAFKRKRRTKEEMQALAANMRAALKEPNQAAVKRNQEAAMAFNATSSTVSILVQTEIPPEVYQPVKGSLQEAQANVLQKFAAGADPAELHSAVTVMEQLEAGHA